MDFFIVARPFILFHVEYFRLNPLGVRIEEFLAQRSSTRAHRFFRADIFVFPGML